jgi:two-component system response regulator HydG
MGDVQGRALIVDDNEDVLFAARLILGEHFAEVATESDPRRLPERLAGREFDVVLLDMNFTRDVTSGQEGFHWLERIRAIAPDAAVIFVTAYADIEMAVRAIKAGAVDFVVKPWQNEKLIATALAAREISRSRREIRDLQSRQRRLSEDIDQPFQDFIGESPAIREVRVAIDKVAGTDADVLLTGENGTGKELVARAIHRQSRRARDVFVRVDLGALTGSLFESELFGHVRGAFTDAREDRPGRFELAAGGTLFLDEIGNIPLELQPKLLTALEARRVCRVGSNHSRDVDIRLVCATNESLPVLVQAGRFRQDLLYRINTVEIRIPPLRERSDDIPGLARHFLRLFSQKYRKEIHGINGPALSKLQAYHWPGNVRELRHAVERAVIMSGTTSLMPADFLFADAGGTDDTLPPDTFNLERVEEIVIRKAMARFGGNVSRVAAEVGLSRPALYRRLKRYDL